jgi:hypothetical protein
VNEKIRSSLLKVYSYQEFCNSLIHHYTDTSFNLAHTQGDPIDIHYYDMKTGLLVLITQHGYEDFLEAVAQKNVRRTGGYVDIRLSLQDRQLIEEDNNIQVRSSQPVGRKQVTRKGRAVKPSRKAKDIVLAENEVANPSQRAGVRRKKTLPTKEVRTKRTFSLEVED